MGNNLSTHKSLFVSGLVLAGVPIVLGLVHAALLNCPPEAHLNNFLKSVDETILGIGMVLGPLIAVSIFSGFCLLCVSIGIWQRSRGVSMFYSSVLGFTPFAVIVVLIMIWLASLNTTSRSKGPDAGAVMSINSIRAAAEIHFDSTGSYTGTCRSEYVLDLLNAAEDASKGRYGQFCAEQERRVTCFDTEEGYATSVRLLNSGANNTKNYFCADSTGYAGKQAVAHSGISCQ